MNNLAIVVPLLLFFHVGAVYYGSPVVAPRHVGAVLRFFGGTFAFLPPLLVVVVLVVQQIVHRESWQVQPTVLAGMIGESILWTIPLIALSYMHGKLAGPEATWFSPAAENLFGTILIATGAGIYEEFIFRLVFISLMILFFADVFGLRKDIVLVVAIVAAGVSFSLYHFTSDQLTGSAPFPLGDFVFLATAGVLWGSVFALRGFAVAVGSHILWDLFFSFSVSTQG